MGRAKNDNSEMKRQVDNHLATIQRLNSEVNNKESVITRLRDEALNLRRENERVKEVNNQDRSRLINEHNNEVRRWEDIEHMNKNKMNDLEKRLRAAEEECDLVKREHQKLKETISGNINKTMS